MCSTRIIIIMRSSSKVHPTNAVLHTDTLGESKTSADQPALAANSTTTSNHPGTPGKSSGDNEATEGTAKDTQELASLFPGAGGTPPEAVTLWVDNKGDSQTNWIAEKEHQLALT